MVDPDDTPRREDVPQDGRPRRPPPVIEGEAIELSADGKQAAAGARGSAARRWLAPILRFLTVPRLAMLAAGCVVVAIIAGGLWLYRVSDGTEVPQHSAADAGASLHDSPGGRSSSTRMETTIKAPAEPASGDPAEIRDLENRAAAADAALAALNARVASLETTMRESAADARAATERADNATRLFNEAKKSGDEQEAAQQLDRGAMDDLASRIKTLESRQTSLRQVQDRLDRLAGTAGMPDRAGRAAVAAAALRNAVERDRPFTAELAAARALGLNDSALTSLEPFAARGLPTRSELFKDLSALLPELRRVSAPSPQELGYLDRLQASAVRMLNIRPVKDEPGDDPPAVLSRIEYKMVQQDIDAIIAELDKLPAPAKELARSWRMKALARRDAIEASRVLATAALAGLGEPATSGSEPR
jgi:hypothetical protein